MVTYTHIHEQMRSSLVTSNLSPESTQQPELDLIENGCQAGGSTATVDNVAGARSTVRPKTFSNLVGGNHRRHGKATVILPAQPSSVDIDDHKKGDTMTDGKNAASSPAAAL